MSEPYGWAVWIYLASYCSLRPCVIHYSIPVAETWRRLWGDGKKFADQDFWITFSYDRNSIFTPNISDDVIFSHRTWFLDFFLSFSRFFISLLPVMSYMSLSSQEKPLLQQIIPRHLFTLFMLSYAPYKHYFSKYWGGRMHGPSPPQIFWGDRPPSPPRSPPVLYTPPNLNPLQFHRCLCAEK